MRILRPIFVAIAAAACAGDGPTSVVASCEGAEEQRARAAVLDLGVGEVLELCDPEAMSAIQLPGGASAREYLVVVANVGAVADQLEHFNIRWARGGAIAARGVEAEPLSHRSPLQQPVGSTATRPREAAELAPDWRIRAHEAALPAPAEAARLWSAVERRGAMTSARRALSSRAPSVGDEVTVRVPDANAANLCFDYSVVTARVRAVGGIAVFLEDVTAPSGGFGEADYAALAAEFDALHASVIQTYFGPLPDVDGDGRVHLLVTPEVNRLTAGATTSFVSGYFFGGDLVPRFDDALWPVCLQSNEGEILYLLAPDPIGRFGAVRSADDVRRQIRGTIVHELQHMANFGVRMRGRAEPEAVWLNEGLSHMAEELAGRRHRGLGDFQQLATMDLIDASTGLRDYQAFFLQNLLRFRAWLVRPDTASPTSAAARAQLAPRGAAWSLVRHVADHHADDDLPAFLRRLTAGPRSGAANLSAASGVPFESLLSAWMLANFSDDLSLPELDDRHRYRSWRMRIAVSEATGSTPTPNSLYPLRITMLADDGAPIGITTRSGSGAYYGVRDVSATGGGLLSLLSAHGAPVNLPGARLLVMRVR